MTQISKCHKLLGWNWWPRRALPCLVPGSIYRTPLRASPIQRICRKPRSFHGAATTRIAPVRDAANAADETTCSPASSMTWGTWFRADPVTFSLSIRNTTAFAAENTSTRTRLTTLGPTRTTPIVSFHWPCGWSSRTACPTKPPAGTCGATTGSLSPSPPSRTGWKPGGKKAARQMWTSYLDWALSDFSGYIAADELYDGPFCVLSIVDNRTFKRLLYQVLDHDPDHKDITKFLQRFRMALRLRGLKLRGVTTDGSPLYPEPLQAVFGDVPHQICEFHILKELTKAILRAVAKVRKKLAADKPAAKRGRPATPEAKRAVRQRERLQRKIGDLFEHRYLFVEHDLTPAQRRTLQRVTRWLPQLR